MPDVGDGYIEIHNGEVRHGYIAKLWLVNGQKYGEVRFDDGGMEIKPFSKELPQLKLKPSKY